MWRDIWKQRKTHIFTGLQLLFIYSQNMKGDVKTLCENLAGFCMCALPLALVSKTNLESGRFANGADCSTGVVSLILRQWLSVLFKEYRTWHGRIPAYSLLASVLGILTTHKQMSGTFRKRRDFMIWEKYDEKEWRKVWGLKFILRHATLWV